MARTDTLELLGTVTEQLGDVARMTPGTPLRAADWNVLVEAVRNLARMVVSRERTTDEFLAADYARRDHEHTGQIALTWLDPETRALIEQSVHGAVEQQAALKAARDEVTQLRKSVDALRTDLNDTRAALDGLRDSDDARGRELNRVALRVEAGREVETTVATFSRRLDTLSTSVAATLAFRDQLTDETGALVDLRGLRTRLDSVETLRDNLLLADGSVVRIRELESALARLESNAVGRDDLDNSILNRLREGSLLDEAGLFDTFAGQMDARLGPRFGTLETATAQLTTDLGATRAALAGHDTAVAQLDGRLAASENQVAALVPLTAQVAAQQGRLAEAESRLQAQQNVLADLPALQTRVGQLEGLTADVGTLRGTVGGLESRVTSAETNLGSIDGLVTNIQGVGQRLTAVEGQLPGLRAAADTTAQQVQQLAALDRRLVVNESQLDTLRGLPDRLDALSTETRELRTWQTTVEDRLGRNTLRLEAAETLAQRVDSVERLTAENRNTLTRLDTRVSELGTNLGAVRNTVEPVSNLATNVDALDTRLKALDTRLKQVESRRVTRAPANPNR